MSAKITLNFIKNKLKKENYILSFGQYYKHNRTKLNVTCPKGHSIKLCWHSWVSGNRCALCANNLPISIHVIKEKFKSRGYSLLENQKYINNKTKLHYKCGLGHESKISYNDLNNGYGCGICAGNNKKTIQEIKSIFKKEKYILVSGQNYVNNKQKINIVCPDGHKWATRWDNWQRGARCKACYDSQHSKNLTINDVKNILAYEGYKIIDNQAYKNTNSKIFYVCPRGHKHYIRMSDWSKGVRCAFCRVSETQSIGAKKIEMILISQNLNFKREFKIDQCRNIKALPFDFAIQSNLGDLFLIEFNGKQHYYPVKKFGGETALAAQIYNDIIKIKYCKENKIPLLIIKYDEVLQIDNIIKSFLKSFNLIYV